EVVPVVFDLGALRDLEAEPDEHVLEPLDGLGDQMFVAVAATAVAVLGEIEPLGFELLGPRRGGEGGAALGDRGFERGPRLVERSARLLSGIRIERAEPLADGGQRAPFAEQVGFDRAQLVQRPGGGDAGGAFARETGDVVDHEGTNPAASGHRPPTQFASSSSSTSTSGSVNRNTLPLPSSDVACSVPPCASTSPRLIHSP